MFTLLSDNQWNLYLQSSMDELQKIAPFIDSIPPLRRLKEDKLYFLKLSLHEVITNAILHGNRNDLFKKIGVSVVVEHNKCILAISDEGSGFTKEIYEECIKKSKPKNTIGGRGLFLIHEVMDSVSFQKKGDKFVVTMTLNA